MTHFCKASQALLLFQGRVIEVDDAPFGRFHGQVLNVDFQAQTALVRIFPRIDYPRLSAWKMTSQTALNFQMPADYQAPFDLFTPNAFQDCVWRTSIPYHSQGDVRFLQCHLWDNKQFYGGFQLLKVKFSQVRLFGGISESNRRLFPEFPPKFGAREQGWPDAQERLSAGRFEDLEIVVGAPARIRDGPNQGILVEVTRVEDDGTVTGVVLPTQETGHISNFRRVGQEVYMMFHVP
jgi:hypothetical protein